jgi:hypothetical protein
MALSIIGMLFDLKIFFGMLIQDADETMKNDDTSTPMGIRFFTVWHHILYPS